MTRSARTVSTTGRLGRFGRAGRVNATSPNSGALNQPAPQLVAPGQAAVVGWPESASRCPVLAAPDHELVNVAFPVGDVDQAGVGRVSSQFGAARKAFQPAHAPPWPRSANAACLRRRSPGRAPTSRHPTPQRHPVRRDRQRRVDVQPVLPQIAQRPQPGNARLAGVIQFRAVLHAQHHRLATHPLDAAIPVRRQHRLPIDSLVRQQPIRALGFAQPPQATGMLAPGLPPDVPPPVPTVGSAAHPPSSPCPTPPPPNSPPPFPPSVRLVLLDLSFQMRAAILGSRCVESTAHKCTRLPIIHPSPHTRHGSLKGNGKGSNFCMPSQIALGPG